MDRHLPPGPGTFALKGTVCADPARTEATKQWPHAPVHQLSEHGIYMVTAGTLHRQKFLDTEGKLDFFEEFLLDCSKRHRWQLEAWAVLANHYHFVARGAPDSTPMREFLQELHSVSARDLNRMDHTNGRQVWHQFWDTRLTYQHAYLARLNYVHQNAVKHGLVSVARDYKWCSAAWFERVASAAQVKTIQGLKIDRVNVPDDF